MIRSLSAWIGPLVILFLVSCGSAPATDGTAASSGEALVAPIAKSSDFAHVDFFPAGVAAGTDAIFVGSVFEGRVLALSREAGDIIGELPPPPGGFVLAFIMHSIGPNRVAVLDAGGFPSPKPFVPAIPRIYEYEYRVSHGHFSASLARTVSFDGITFGFSEDMVSLGDGRYLISDAVLGSIWQVAADGSIHPGIVPKTFDPADAIPSMFFCDTMPVVQVGGLPFLFTDSTVPGVSPLAVRNGIVYFYSPCAGGTFKFPLAILSDSRQPFERATDIRLVASKPNGVEVEELLEFAFNPFDAKDNHIYAADALQLRVIRIDPLTGAREIIGDDPQLFNFPSSLGFAPPLEPTKKPTLFVVSNQQHRTTITNDAISTDVLELPFIITKVVLKDR